LTTFVRCLPESGYRRHWTQQRGGHHALSPRRFRTHAAIAFDFLCFTFFVSLALALVAMLVRYVHAPVPIINASHVFDLLAIACVVLTIGVLFRRV
jgi:hypothetical protein